MQKEKRFFILMEILVAFTLASFVIGALLFSLRSTLFLQARTEKGEREVLERAAIQQRLNSLIFSLVFPSHAHLEHLKKAPLLLKEENKESILYLAFDNQVDPHPDFCGTLEAKLHLKKDGRFCLTLQGQETRGQEIWGQETRGQATRGQETRGQETKKKREEVLLKGVKEVKYAFLLQDEQGTFTEKQHYDEKESTLPYAIKLTIKMVSNHIFESVFWLPLYPQPILYDVQK